ncbi:uncharacterized protein [Montipora capricornis]|uniref:uncharacterized protein isoform X1 n=3 Tax=Montipora capricornis TaxID=246305 RepID=UPI0035F19013
MDEINSGKFDSGYHHHKTQWFDSGKVTGKASSGFLYGSDHPRDKSTAVFPKEPQRANPFAMQDTQRPLSKNYHLRNAHNRGFELGLSTTDDSRPLNEKFTRKQHFVQGGIPGGSASNKMIYGTDEILRQAKRKEKPNTSGFLYGTDAATKVGRHDPAPRPNNPLWLEERTECDALRNQKLAQAQDEFLAKHHEEKARQQQVLREEKRKDLAELRSYDPWGRPGGGAPLAGVDEKHETKRTRNVSTLVQEGNYQLFGGRQGGGGAPNRTESGRIVAGFRSDPELRFPKHADKVDVEPVLRYGGRNERYRQELDSMIEGSRARKIFEREKSIEDEIHHIEAYSGQFGKEGAGAPRKTGSGTVKAGFPTTLSKDIEELRKVNQRIPQGYSQDRDSTEYNPWGRGFGNPPAFNIHGRMEKPAVQQRNADETGIFTSRPGAGAPNVDEHGNLKLRKGQTLTKGSNGQTVRDFSPVDKRNVYDPWGRSGAGAPIKDPEGQIQTRTAGKVVHDSSDFSPQGKMDVQAKHQLLSTLINQSEESKQRRKAEHDDLLKTDKDVASWVRSGIIGQPSYDAGTKEIVASKKNTSDVTSQALNIRRPKNEKSHQYHVDLETQAHWRDLQRKKSAEEQRIKSVEHLKTMDRMWGRPGAGAPLSQEQKDFARKQKLGLVPADSTAHTYR